ncbi:MAG: hypothetical protein GF368_03910 [Candidatus Aenigmarchaeota archaeon]|nr:hypothetical protein [Candidatus Aenigmarchaeota archaeon]
MRTLKLFSLIIFALILFAGTIFCLDILNTSIDRPEDFVDNVTYDHKSGIFHDYSIIRYPARASIVDLRTGDNRNLIGISTESWVLDFGIAPIGNNTVKKKMTLSTKEGEGANIKLEAFGNISEMVNFGRNNFHLEGKDTIFVFLNVTENIEVGNYTGEVDVIIRHKKIG